MSLLNLRVFLLIISSLCLFNEVTGIAYCVDQDENLYEDGETYTYISGDGWIFSCVCNTAGTDDCSLVSCVDSAGVSHTAGPEWTTTESNGLKRTCHCPVERGSDGLFHLYCSWVPQCYSDGQYYDEGETIEYTSGSWAYNCICNPTGPDECKLVSCRNGQAAGEFVPYSPGSSYKCVCPEDTDNGYFVYFCVYQYSDGDCHDPTSSTRVDPGSDITKQFLEEDGSVNAQFTCECLADDSCQPSST